MCIFSADVQQVSHTRVFARVVGESQYLVYEMRLVTEADVAMILPLPTPASDGEQLKFIDLSGYPDFFDDMARCFPVPMSWGLSSDNAVAVAGPPLEVHRVGAFDASFVPGVSEFYRLDARFRLPDAIWSQLPYADFSFAVFQLRAGAARIHPMAFCFKSQNPSAAFFPTAHVHDGTVHSTASFDHVLYAQGAPARRGWALGSAPPRKAMDFGNLLLADRTKGIVEPDTLLVRKQLQGPLPNQDVWLSLSASAG
jgi:hypothetical protein